MRNIYSYDCFYTELTLISNAIETTVGYGLLLIDWGKDSLISLLAIEVEK
ncbi:hypothetical protein Barb4_04374 [Bacteroidales bacterium Barb4]|nr:hypothetical protein Barb4_04374 [Bacteroidales bacterium Barb4]